MKSAPSVLPEEPPGGVTCGIDWARDDHAVAVVDARGRPVHRCVIEDSAAGLRALLRVLGKCGAGEVAIERPDGPVVDALLEAGITVVVISPNQVKNLRGRYGSAGNKDGRLDGGFNWSSQHLDLEVWRYGCRETPAGDSCDARADVVARRAVGWAARGPGAVLGGDRWRRVERGRGGRGWRVAGRRLEMVPPGWRDAADHAGPAAGAIPVVR